MFCELSVKGNRPTHFPGICFGFVRLCPRKATGRLNLICSSTWQFSSMARVSRPQPCPPSPRFSFLPCPIVFPCHCVHLCVVWFVYLGSCFVSSFSLVLTATTHVPVSTLAVFPFLETFVFNMSLISRALGSYPTSHPDTEERHACPPFVLYWLQVAQIVRLLLSRPRLGHAAIAAVFYFIHLLYHQMRDKVCG